MEVLKLYENQRGVTSTSLRHTIMPPYLSEKVDTWKDSISPVLRRGAYASIRHRRNSIVTLSCYIALLKHSKCTVTKIKYSAGSANIIKKRNWEQINIAPYAHHSKPWLIQKLLASQIHCSIYCSVELQGEFWRKIAR